MLESTYEACLAHELALRGLRFARQQEIPLIYRNERIPVAYRADFLIESKLLLELKSTDALTPMHKAQVITYLKLLKMPLGLLVNFNTRLLKDGWVRVLGFPPSLKTLERHGGGRGDQHNDATGGMGLHNDATTQRPDRDS